ncbi:MAG: hypothetical protein ACRDYY_02810 [Acidimicrobiales bacterium]
MLIRPFGRAAALASAALVAGALVAGCGSSTHSAATGSTQSKSTVACSSTSASKRVAVVVEASAKSVVERCLDAGAGSLSALTALTKSGVEIGTQKYSFGVAICQLDNVPTHYSKCLPSGQPYWAMFVSQGGQPWASASKGVSETSLANGDAVGFRYDPPQGNPAPPSVPPSF